MQIVGGDFGRISAQIESLNLRQFFHTHTNTDHFLKTAFSLTSRNYLWLLLVRTECLKI